MAKGFGDLLNLKSYQPMKMSILKSLDGQSWDKEGKYNGKTVFEAAPPGERVLGWLPEEEDYSYPNIGEDECAGIVEKGAFFTWKLMTHWVSSWNPLATTMQRCRIIGSRRN